MIEDNLFRTFGSGPLVQMYSVAGLTRRISNERRSSEEQSRSEAEGLIVRNRSVETEGSYALRVNLLQESLAIKALFCHNITISQLLGISRKEF